MDKLDTVIQELQEMKAGQQGFEEQLSQMNHKMDRLEVKFTELDDKVGKLDVNVAELNDTVNSHSAILQDHTEQLAKIGADVSDIKHRQNRSEESAPQDIMAMLELMDDKLKPLDGINDQFQHIDARFDRVDDKLFSKDSEMEVLNHRLFQVESTVQEIKEK